VTLEEAISIAARAVEGLGTPVAFSRDEIAKWPGQSINILKSARFYPADDGDLVPDGWKGRDFWIICFKCEDPPDYNSHVEPEGPMVFLDDKTQEIEMPLQL